MIHQLKCEHTYFEDAVAGNKTFEYRKNDRDFHIGDYLALNELTEHACNDKGEHLETGRCALFRVHYILNDPKYLKDNYVILGIEACGVACLGIGCEPDILDEVVLNNE